MKPFYMHTIIHQRPVPLTRVLARSRLMRERNDLLVTHFHFFVVQAGLAQLLEVMNKDGTDIGLDENVGQIVRKYAYRA